MLSQKFAQDSWHQQLKVRVGGHQRLEHVHRAQQQTSGATVTKTASLVKPLLIYIARLVLQLLPAILYKAREEPGK